MKRFVLLLLIAGGGWYYWPVLRTYLPPQTITPPVGMLAVSEPQQITLSSAPFPYKNYQITPLARYDLTVRVLGRESYWTDQESGLAPMDLAVGWQQMSNSIVLAHVRVTQGTRWYYFQTDGVTIAADQIVQQSANMHLIPATPDLKQQIRALPVGSVVHLSGYLVQAVGADGWRWQSSLSRDDTGPGSCELMYVTALEREI